ncbi:MAG: Rieske (2Fe-2S) protein [Gammaproteobacteria bacterium]
MPEKACLPAELLDSEGYLTVDVLIGHTTSRVTQANVIVFRYAGRVYAYVNQCMHMHRALDCLQDAVFDAERRRLRCSMHGFVFEPETGVCLSSVCEGQSLRSIPVEESNSMIIFKAKHLQILSVHSHGKAVGEDE